MATDTTMTQRFTCTATSYCVEDLLETCASQLPEEDPTPHRRQGCTPTLLREPGPVEALSPGCPAVGHSSPPMQKAARGKGSDAAYELPLHGPSFGSPVSRRGLETSGGHERRRRRNDSRSTCERVYRLLEQVAAETRRHVLANCLSQSQRLRLEKWILTHRRSSGDCRRTLGTAPRKCKESSTATSRKRKRTDEAIQSSPSDGKLTCQSAEARCKQRCCRAWSRQVMKQPAISVYLGWNLHAQILISRSNMEARSRCHSILQALRAQAETQDINSFKKQVKAAFLALGRQSKAHGQRPLGVYKGCGIQILLRTRLGFARELRLETPWRSSALSDSPCMLRRLSKRSGILVV
eukprot:TRINITY_DN34902_c0_g1_i5.p1 TRINITY_DN34902_c0_g1~~TRINITY_DN34902_c0_g1_i5.p1  ORF type:complete len:352 (+),score=31.49 TRINITY_DN34902_c0_g1_i5:290-1345(+)